ncbi:hypothetical protein QQY79_05410 [Flavobacterium tructae]|uniref:imm11 family protein n=1 Tax=Flavobacterium tructae TaxID=1114873 RepID=UPI00255203E3|nr:DUF1629 domain-containing protein [Flavobacterium tructae]MDL2141948.1 hypothetical protein [Flavobacterium tructae]
MKYYFINNSLNNKIVGDYNQVQGAQHHCDIWEDPNFIDKIDFIKIDFQPIISNAILSRKAKLTDLINAQTTGFSLRLLISSKLKDILEKYSKEKGQFFRSPVIYQNKSIDGYWIFHPHFFESNSIDYLDSKILIRKRKSEGGTFLEKIKVENDDDFKIQNLLKNEDDYIYISNLKIKKDFHSDFFLLSNTGGGIGYIVSENLKKEIEDASCTGIEFQPVELSTTEWLHGGEREKIYGKA